MHYIDLSHYIENSMPVYPGDIEVSLQKSKHLDKDEYNAFTLLTGLHAGTHIDCPMHLLGSTKTIAEYPIECFVGNGVLIDARGQDEIGLKPEYHDKIKTNDIVLIYTGMDENYGSYDYYHKHPVIKEGLAELLIYKRVKMLGIDMPSPDYEPFNIHKLLLGNNIFIMENMAGLGQLIQVDWFEVFAQPLKVKAEASLVRAFARYAW